ncbi:ABC-type nitrate/sulfonate/bicarbonate transport system, substrate-binding protein [Parafrankia irregularis]|uniref:Thiamine pyrimidine synthase n=1 Tax=Parafrankia irregularis TaxID=795642 RepID=A0A0S4QRE8_9ACTN|nr:ABC transporter substrate-binding protein [Parafrankia sp. CH37]CUU57892.1 ABC-type nitrate/sulfonate/bicarbonate transport system, substrate-binding protein [Parafrankia irregularis]
MGASVATGSTRGLDRRGFLRSGLGASAGAALLALGGGSLLAACGDDDSEGAAAGGSGFGTLDMRLSWIKNVEFAGAYIADQRGYYREAGFSKVNLMAGGPSATPQDTDVATGKAFIGISAPDITGNAILNGAPIKIIGAQYQKNPFAIVSMADKPLSGPEDMIGKKIGVQATNESVWSSFLKANSIDPSSIEKVPVEFDPLPLTTGTVDGWFSFVTNEPNLLRVKGFEVTSFLLADHNYPLVSETYMVRTESIEKERDKIKAVLTADIRGWKDSLADPTLGAHLAATVYGKDLGLDEDEQVLESKDQNKLVLTDDTKANGLFTITDELVEENIRTLGIAGVAITAEELFDLSIIKEIYAAKPDLV